MAVSAELQQFVWTNVPTTWALEQLLLMARPPVRPWTPIELLAELRSSTSLVAANLELFERSGLLIRHGDTAYQFVMTNEGMRRQCEALETLYRERPHFVRNTLIPRKDRLQELADAFKLREDPD